MLHEHLKATLLTDHSTTLLTVSSCICYTCFKRCQHNKTIVRKRAIFPKQCQLKHCERAFHSNWYLPSVSDVSGVSSVSGGASVSEVEALLDERVTGFEVRDGSTVIGLCREHYNKLYQLSSAVPECAFCGTEQRGNALINRRCPEPDKINTYLKQTQLDAGNLTSNDHICFRCYTDTFIPF